MPESGSYGSVRGVLSNGHSYRDSILASKSAGNTSVANCHLIRA